MLFCFVYVGVRAREVMKSARRARELRGCGEECIASIPVPAAMALDPVGKL